MEWLKKWLTDGFTKVPLLSISVNLTFFKKYGSKYSCTCRVNKLFKNDWYIKRTMEDLCEYIRKNYIPRNKEFGGAALARKFNVGSSVIRLIVHNRTYKNVV